MTGLDEVFSISANSMLTWLLVKSWAGENNRSQVCVCMVPIAPYGIMICYVKH